MSNRRVVITGLGVISPVGNNVQEFWASLVEGKSGIDYITRFDTSNFSTKIAGEVKHFDPLRFIQKKDLKKHDLFSQFTLAAASEAWMQSVGENETPPYNSDRVGSVLGVGIGGLSSLEQYHQAYLEGGPKKISPFLIPRMISNLAPGNIAIRYGLKGVNFTITSACSSATHAIGEAYRMIKEGIQDMVVTGGSESTITPVGIGGFIAMKALSSRNDEPTRASRPFDKDRDGFVMGEGSAILILESLDGAKARGADILAEVIGYGVSCDAFHITAPSEGGEGAVACMKAALQSGGIEPEDVDYINAHGTSTPANDITETMAIKKTFGNHAKNLMVSSSKSMTGHLLGAAGAIETVVCVLSCKHGVVPPTINLDEPGEGCDLDYVANEARDADVRVALNNSFGFGGTNATLLVRRFEG